MSDTTKPSPPAGDATEAADAVQVEDVGDIIRIVDPELDVDAIMAEIRANLAKRPPLDPDPSSLVYQPSQAALLSTQNELEWLVEQASECQRDLYVGDQLRPASGLIGGLATRAKRPIHQLTRFYVDLLARKQAALEGHVVRALDVLTKRSASTQEELAKLRQEVEQLRQELAEARGASPAEPSEGQPATPSLR